jgi:hypothetical protein
MVVGQEHDSPIPAEAVSAIFRCRALLKNRTWLRLLYLSRRRGVGGSPFLARSADYDAPVLASAQLLRPAAAPAIHNQPGTGDP